MPSGRQLFTFHFSLFTFFPPIGEAGGGLFSLYTYAYALTYAIAFNSDEICTFHPMGVEDGCFLKMSSTETLSIC